MQTNFIRYPTQFLLFYFTDLYLKSNKAVWLTPTLNLNLLWLLRRLQWKVWLILSITKSWPLAIMTICYSVTFFMTESQIIFIFLSNSYFYFDIYLSCLLNSATAMANHKTSVFLCQARPSPLTGKFPKSLTLNVKPWQRLGSEFSKVFKWGIKLKAAVRYAASA